MIGLPEAPASQDLGQIRCLICLRREEGQITQPPALAFATPRDDLPTRLLSPPTQEIQHRQRGAQHNERLAGRFDGDSAVVEEKLPAKHASWRYVQL